MVFFGLGKNRKADRSEKLDRPDKGDADSSGSSAAAQPTPEKAEKKKKSQREDVAMSVQSSRGDARVAGGGARAGLSVNDFISKTKNQQRQGLKPSGPELIAYARYLGIDPVADHDLLWIAVEALDSPLPCDWTEHFDSNDRVFYYNATQRMSSWTHPLEHIFRDTYKQVVNFRNSNMPTQERNEKIYQLEVEVQQMEHDVHREIAQWTEHKDEQGNLFYFNREERQSSWTDPRPAKCQVLYLRMKMLRLLAPSASFADGRFGPFSDEDQAFKRPKVGRDAGNVDESLGSAGPGTPSSRGSPHGSDTDTAEEKDRGRAKKKKKKKVKRRDQGESSQRTVQTGRNSLSEHSCKHPVDDARGLGLQSSMTLGHFDHVEGLSSVGRAKVKSGIRLQPLPAPTQPPADDMNMCASGSVAS